MFSADFYNRLPSITDATTALGDPAQVFADLAPLFASYEGLYSVCVVHRHFQLQPGEWMVSQGLITRPETTTSPADSLIVPERWTSEGVPFEFMRADSTEIVVPAPPTDFMTEFQKIVGNISVLGVCLASPKLPEGDIYWETTKDTVNRTHVLQVVQIASIDQSPGNTFTTAWSVGGDDITPMMKCTHNCTVGCADVSQYCLRKN